MTCPTFGAAAEPGIRAAALFATGVAAAGPEGATIRGRIDAPAARAGTVVVGPSGTGMLSPAASSPLSLGIVEDAAAIRGNVGCHPVTLLTDGRRYGSSHVAFSGDEAVTGPRTTWLGSRTIRRRG